MRFNAGDVTNRRVAVVAAGMVSPLGIGLPETLESLRTAKDCVAPIDRFDVDRCRCKTAAQVPESGRQPTGENEQEGRLHPASHMMIRALKELLDQDDQF